MDPPINQSINQLLIYAHKAFDLRLSVKALKTFSDKRRARMRWVPGPPVGPPPGRGAASAPSRRAAGQWPPQTICFRCHGDRPSFEGKNSIKTRSGFLLRVPLTVSVYRSLSLVCVCLSISPACVCLSVPLVSVCLSVPPACVCLSAPPIDRER